MPARAGAHMGLGAFPSPGLNSYRAASAVTLPGRVVYHTDLDSLRAASVSHESAHTPTTLFIDGEGDVSK